MAPPGPLRVLSHGGRRFLCFCGDGGSSARLQLTDACEFWSCSVSSEKLNGQEEPGSPAGSLSRLREILQGQTPILLTLHDGKATLQVQHGGQSVTFDLDKASLPEARRQLQDLTFGLVEQLQTLEKRLEEGTAAATSVALRSPEKISPSQSLLGADFSPRKPRGEAGPIKRRLPGESLINPGFRSKKTPMGVDFEDA
ncbi:protein PAXX isoform X2 [Ahaetulla prasina]|uniref:protein PAXX isoform X2 n=1 Tax=Ahaetulla prasina TaxID=499056 RepID=UPI002648D345|nr:protein PAXX isoform X2 [Ahaetulla prasina]